ncbi:class I SAM-dependent methyltransferase [Kaustia mangrovi]|uniref:Class I SAM-dependent methyltransferase n=1 Tax=Kaustia mangrovi TaxID=2593653 RepID=A0A7S8C7G7_9HYPH|nr:methyltransferase domain-containing protein [Kaustia mangrovi]QPC44737.1 class I SAM-dependent methyltransferase [Kaustia mangrovi]
MTGASPADWQSWSAEQYGTHARFVADLAGEIVSWLAPRPGERILDLGCGDGALTEQLAATGAEVVGVDASEDLARAARARGLDIRVRDGEALDFEAEFDAVFSNAALHWMTRPEKVVAGIRRALKPGGRFVAEFGGHGNVAAIATALRATARTRGGDQGLASPWYFPSTEDYGTLLGEHGFSVRRIGLYPRQTPLKSGMAAWLAVFREPFFAQYGEERTVVAAEVEDLLRPALCDAHGNWMADYVRLRVEAVLA